MFKKQKIKRFLSSHKKECSIAKKILLFAIIFSLGATSGYFYAKKTFDYSEKDIYIEFLSEIYDNIKEHYWEKLTDEQLSNFFKLGTEQLAKKPQILHPPNKKGLKIMWQRVMKDMKGEEKKKFSIQLADLVLKNLQPFGRNALYTQKDAVNLKIRVENINPETKKVEPTVFSKLIRPDIFYIHIKKFSPTTFEEFQQQTQQADRGEKLNTLILDLRDNVGGSIDILPYFLGPFIGKDQYAFEFFHQGEKTPFKTKIGWLPSLVRYKKVVILINENTQSSAEVFAATLKKYNVGVLIGTRTRGWGTVEKIFPLKHQIDPNQNYSLFLVHSLTLREDGQPIEGKGVEPVINIKNSDWQKQLFAYFHYKELIEAVKEVLEQKPL